MRHVSVMEDKILIEDDLGSAKPSEVIVIQEGKARMTFPKTCSVFYNPVQEFNRDLSVAVIKEHILQQQEVRASVNSEPVNSKVTDSAEQHPHENNGVDKTDLQQSQNKMNKMQSQDSVEQGITVLEALAASGLRAIRYAKEIPNIKNIVANDWSKQAVETIQQNIKNNEVEHLVTASQNDAVLVMHEHKSYNKQFDVVDIDPYGCPTQFLDAAVQSVKDGGLLCVTCTDVAILCGNASETCYAKYGSMSLKTNCYHEMALRIVLQCIESHANRYGRYIIPLISLSVDFYVRFFVRIYTSPAVVKRTASKLAMVYECVGCETISLQPLGKMKRHENGRDYRFSCADGPPVGSHCVHCNASRHRFGGPVWAGNIHDAVFVQKLLSHVENEATNYSTAKRMIGMLYLLKEELPDVPFFYSLDRIHSTVHIAQCKLTQFRSALLNAGYRVSDTHTCKNSVKTDAPAHVVWDIVRFWAKQINSGKKIREDHGKVILDQEITTNVSFEFHPEANPESKEKGLLRYQQNPAPFWGPKSRSTVNTLNETEQAKSKKFQGKRSKKVSSESSKRVKQGKCIPGEDEMSG